MGNDEKKKILIICIESINVYTFRSGLIRALKEKGADVYVIAFDDKYKTEIEALGTTFFCVEGNNRGLNPLQMMALQKKYGEIIKTVQPDIVFTFALKPNLFGVVAAKKAGVKQIYAMVEGAGDAFIHNSLKWKVIRFVVCQMYRRAFKYAKKVFFLNNDDKAEFINRKLVKAEQCEIVHGIGVDLEKFAYKPIKNKRTFLMIARMLRTKGLFEYCEAARLVRKKYPDAVFNYLGAEADVKVADIQEYIDDGSIRYLGTTKDVRPYLEDCVLLLLSSYREGLPMSIMEAEATGRAIITSNGVGCRDTVEDGYNGFLVPQKDVGAMAEKIIWFIENPEKIEEMGLNARKFAEERFDSRKINEKIISIMGAL